MTQKSLSPVVVDSQRTLEAILRALPAAYRDDPQFRHAREALEHAREHSSVLLLLLPHEAGPPPEQSERVATDGNRPTPTRGSADVVGFGDLVLRCGRREMSRGPRKTALTATESRLLELFLRHPGQILPRGLIFEHVWGFDVGATSNVLNVYIGYLRRKTEAGGEPRLIHTVRGIGYVLRN
jgi:DNA-binding response OmpR family regulator